MEDIDYSFFITFEYDEIDDFDEISSILTEWDIYHPHFERRYGGCENWYEKRGLCRT